MVFDPLAGGAVHGRCGGGAAIRIDDLVEMEALRRTPLSETVGHSLSLSSRWLLSDFVQHQVGRKLASRTVLEQMSDLLG